ncbi:MAG TPA: DUF3800 domain-containing protein [Chthoniobacterales bacterium]
MSRPCSLSGVGLCGDSLVRHIYIDESGVSTNDKVLVIAGVVIDPDRQYLEVANEINKLILEFVPVDRRNNFAFHAKDLFHGTGRTPFDRRTYPRERARQALRQLVSIPARFCLPIVFGFVNKSVPDHIREKVFAKLKPRQKISNDAGTAFSMCAVAAEVFMKTHAPERELATMHAEQNPDIERMIRIVRKSLGGKTRFNIAELLSRRMQGYLPITKIIDEISFHHKDDAFLLQIADAAALILRYLLEEKQGCDDLFEAFFTQKNAAAEIQKRVRGNGAGHMMLAFTEPPS